MQSISNKPIYADELISQVSQVVEVVVRKYVARKAVPKREQEDVTMIVLEKFIDQKEKIMSSFQGKSSFNTYCVAIVNRMVCEVIRKENRSWYSVVEKEQRQTDNTQNSDFGTANALILKNEVVRFEQSLLFFNGSGAKVNLFLKYYFNLPLQLDDYHKYGPECGDELQQMLPYVESKSKGITFEQLAKAVNLVEGKELKGDAVRMWLNKQMDIILDRLNSTGGSNHDKESLAILCEMSSVNYTKTSN